MTSTNQKHFIQDLIREYVEHAYNECPDSFIIAKDGVEMTVTEWCKRFGGTPKGKSNFEFLNAQFKKGRRSIHDKNEDQDGYDE